MEKLPKLVLMNKHYKLVVEQQLEQKIRHLCNKLPNNEYSGTLFFTVTGTFENDDLIVHCKDFYIQDIGTSTFTSFEHKDNIMGYMVDNDLIDCYTGLMHSHNVMSTAPSGTDINTIQKEGDDTNHFVSLIVNNAGSYRAWITRKITTVKTLRGTNNISYHTFENKVVKNNNPVNDTITETIIEYYPLDITIEGNSQDFSELDERIEFLRNSPDSYVNNHGNKAVVIDNNTTIAQMPQPDTLANRKANSFTIPTLFDGQNDNPYEPITSIKIPENIVNDAVKQIITGNVFSQYNSKLDLNQWGKNMEKIYNMRFGDATDDFQMWAQCLIDFLLWELPYIDFGDEVVKQLGMCEEREYNDTIEFAWTDAVVDTLGEFPSNKYLDYFIEYLTNGK